MKGDLGISGRHMEIFHKEGSLFIRDLRSTNGTFVNGVRIQADHRIQPNDLLLLGGTELRVII
jgi:pSer/pThr/pTyr-binding forkhead associated (FHA) protein